MKKILELLNVWSQLDEPTKEAVRKNLPWILAALVAGGIACYLGFCACCKVEGSPPFPTPAQMNALSPWGCCKPASPSGSHARARTKSCPCSPQCTCGCNQGRRCVCEGPIRPEGKVAGPNYGVDKDRIEGPKYEVRGKQVSRQEAIDAVTGAIPDESKKLHLTVIGPADARARVLEDLKKEPLAGLADRLLVQAYDPSHWAVKDAGFVTGGSPTVYLQARDGKVLHRQDSYDGPQKLAEAIRRADPKYDPKADPNLTSPLGGVLALFNQIPPVGWLLVGGGVLYLLLRKGN
jgi:hypothetical protein